ncbi:MAG: hypothetical protein Q7R96_03420 [Nanoarchaeota archaeon]|nr:hypothetical protein [Nanoarchaeota archaeon]
MRKGALGIQIMLVILVAIVALTSITINNFSQQKEEEKDVQTLPLEILDQYQQGNRVLTELTTTAHLAACTSIKNYLTLLSSCTLTFNRSNIEAPCILTEQGITTTLEPLFIQNSKKLSPNLSIATNPEDYTYSYNLTDNTWTGTAFTPISIPGTITYTIQPDYKIILPELFKQLLDLSAAIEQQKICILSYTPLLAIIGKKDVATACGLPLPEGLTLEREQQLIHLTGTLPLTECLEDIQSITLTYDLTTLPP